MAPVREARVSVARCSCSRVCDLQRVAIDEALHASFGWRTAQWLAPRGVVVLCVWALSILLMTIKQGKSSGSLVELMEEQLETHHDLSHDDVSVKESCYGLSSLNLPIFVHLDYPRARSLLGWCGTRSFCSP
jgi:hypothetical protein